MKFNGLCLVILLLLLGPGDSQRGPNGRQARQRGQQWGGTSQGGLGGQQVDPAANKGNNWAPSTQAQFPSTTSYPGGNNWGPSTTTGMFIGSGGGGGGGGGGPVTSGVRSGNGAGGTGAAAGGGGTGSGGGGGGGGGGAWGPPQTTTVAPTTGAGGWGAPSSPSSAPVQGGRGGGGRGGGGGTGGRGGAGRRRGPNGRGGARGGGGGGGFEYGIGGGRGGGAAAPAAPAAPVATGGIFGGSLMGWHHGAIEPGNFEPEPTYIIAGPGATPYNAGAMSGGGAFAGGAAAFGAGSSLMFQWPSNGNWYYSNGPIKIGYRVCPQLAQRVAECGKGPMTPCAPLCKVYPTAKCLVNPCGGCFAEWYLGNRRLLDCD